MWIRFNIIVYTLMFSLYLLHSQCFFHLKRSLRCIWVFIYTRFFLFTWTLIWKFFKPQTLIAMYLLVFSTNNFIFICKNYRKRMIATSKLIDTWQLLSPNDNTVLLKCHRFETLQKFGDEHFLKLTPGLERVLRTKGVFALKCLIRKDRAFGQV